MKRKEQAVQFLICLDFLVKGLLVHWQIKLKEQGETKRLSVLKGFGTALPILVGDQYYAMAYYSIARLGNVELTHILALIEENIQKIFFCLEQLPTEFSANLEFIYNHFYNYLPQFMGNSFHGLGLIFDISTDAMKELGVELGYFFQFGIFSYIMTAIIS